MNNQLQAFTNEQLIPLTENETGDVIVSARDVYSFLGLNERFSKWWDRMSTYGFTEDVDYTPYQMVHPQNKQEIEDYLLTLDTAKELCMLARNEKGKEARTYFIAVEKAWNSPEMIMKRALEIANKQVQKLQLENKKYVQQIEEQKPLVVFAETCVKSKDNILVRQVAKIASDEGIIIGEKKLYQKLREWGLILKGSTEPSQYAQDREWFKVDEKPINTAYGVKLTRTSKVTPKGQIYIIEKLKKELEESKVNA